MVSDTVKLCVVPAPTGGPGEGVIVSPGPECLQPPAPGPISMSTVAPFASTDFVVIDTAAPVSVKVSPGCKAAVARLVSCGLVFRRRLEFGSPSAPVWSSTPVTEVG